MSRSSIDGRSPATGIAIHGIVQIDGKSVEIQIRTGLQHQWAELSEQFSDRFPGLKYGQAHPEVLELLLGLSDYLRDIEEGDAYIPVMQERLLKMAPGLQRDDIAGQLDELKREHEEMRKLAPVVLSQLRSFLKVIGPQ